MNDTEQILLELLKNALHGQACAADTAADWSAVFEEASIQTVAALAAAALPPTLSEEERAPWREAQYRELSLYVRYLHAQDELCSLLSANGISMAILKGSAAALYYPTPSLRAMGDIDFIVPEDQLPRTRALLLENGYSQMSENKGRHEELKKNGIEVELHARFSFNEALEKRIACGLQETERGSIDGHEFPMLPKLTNGLVLLYHMKQHLKGGLGLRQLIDWMMYVERELDDAYWEAEFYAAAQARSLDVLAITAARICQKYLGLNESLRWCAGADEKLCDALLNNLLRSGNFGRKHGAGAGVEKVTVAISKRGFFRNLQHAGVHNWRALRKHPWLRPLAWLYQIFRYAGQALRTKRSKHALEDISRGRERYELLKKLHID